MKTLVIGLDCAAPEILLRDASLRSIDAPAIWDLLGAEAKRVVVVRVPPNYPPRKVNGVSVGCFLTPDPDKSELPTRSP